MLKLESDLGKRVGELSRFINRDKEDWGLLVGDLVLTPLPEARVMYGVVAGPYRFNPDYIGFRTQGAGIFPHERPLHQRVGVRARRDLATGIFTRQTFYQPKAKDELLQLFAGWLAGF